MKSRVSYGDDGLLDEVVADAGMHFENLGDQSLFIRGFRADGSSVVLYIHGRVALVEEWPAEGSPPAPTRRAPL